MKNLKCFIVLALLFGFEFIFPLGGSVKAQGYALNFDGNNDYVEIKDNALLSGGPGKSITIEAWVYPRKLEGSVPIVMKELETNWKDWGLNISSGKLSICIESHGDDWTYKAGNILPNVWTHVAFTFDNPSDKVRLFINGIEAGPGASLLKDMPDTDVPVWIGKNYYRVEAMDGLIDEVRIWNFARTQAEIQSTMNMDLKGTEPGLIGYWRFDEGSGQVASDSSGNGNHGQLGSTANVDMNDPTWVVSDAPIVGFITVISPNGGENWPVGSTKDILWISTGPISEVKIEYSIDGGFIWDKVVGNTANDGSYSWIIPNSLSDKCLLRISDADDGEPFDDSDYAFTIHTPILKTTLGFGSSGWNMISVPLNPEYSSPEAVFGYDINTLKIWSYDPNKDECVYPDSIKLGTGYWIMVSEDTQVEVTGLPAPTDEPYILHLVPGMTGWLLIGNPFSVEIELNNMRILRDQQMITLEQAYAMKWLYKDLFEWHKKDAEGDYDQYKIVSLPEGRLYPWQGYWVLVLVECDLLLYPFEPPSLFPETPLVTIDSTKSTQNWRIQLMVYGDRMADTENYFGISNIAQDTYDATDLPEPPWLLDCVALFFPHEEWGQKPARYARDIRAPLDSEISKTWEIDIVNSYGSGEITLTWQGVTSVSQEYAFQLVDKDHPGVVYDMRKTRQIQCAFPEKIMIRHFQVVVSRATSCVPDKNTNFQEVYALFQNYPNPFNKGTVINYNIPTSSKVIISIYNLSGQRIKNLIEADKLAGYHTVCWDGRDDQGDVVTSGVYVFQIKAGNFVGTKKLVFFK